MKRLTNVLMVLVATGTLLTQTAGSARAGDPPIANPLADLQEVLGSRLTLGGGAGLAAPAAVALPSGHTVIGGRSHCGHVVDLLVRNCMRQLRALELGIQPGARVGIAPGPHVPRFVLGPLPGDLELLEVHAVNAGAGELGPLYQVSFRNNSHAALYDFRITLVAVLGQIAHASPTTTVPVACLEAGQIGKVQVQMPAAALAMGPEGQQLLPFDKLVVAIDSFDELIERNELNNVAILRRPEIQVLVVAGQAPAAAAPNQAVEAIPAPATPNPNPAPAPSLAPGDNATLLPNDKVDLDTIDLDELDLDDAEETAMRIIR